ncbi:hypothetical protein BDA99DRAFT_532189 [Phascolomyces articulosus]|uniref:Uncharacterized protein n=1 Tax=Phascolomyces articulosus TaxID=60185 RepID=A0AAD5PLL0_9FUNG|nr:hypothetical protein BDA99DRAFT_532189 [Phascolomyces articulosus]
MGHMVEKYLNGIPSTSFIRFTNGTSNYRKQTELNEYTTEELLELLECKPFSFGKITNNINNATLCRGPDKKEECNEGDYSMIDNWTWRHTCGNRFCVVLEAGRHWLNIHQLAYVNFKHLLGRTDENIIIVKCPSLKKIKKHGLPYVVFLLLSFPEEFDAKQCILLRFTFIDNILRALSGVTAVLLLSQTLQNQDTEAECRSVPKHMITNAIITSTGETAGTRYIMAASESISKSHAEAKAR